MTNSVSKQPKALYICGIAFTLERFAYYGSRTLLLLFLAESVVKGGLGIPKSDAAIIAANLAAFTYLSPIFGGYICDRWIGARYCVVIGSFIMAAGYAAASFAQNIIWIHVMIILVAIGMGFFKGNLYTLAGEFYEDNKSKDSAFAILYTFVNMGTFLGSLLIGIMYTRTFAVVEAGEIISYGFRQCFMVSAIMNVLGGLLFMLNSKHLGEVGKLPQKVYDMQKKNLDVKKDKNTPLTAGERGRVIVIFVLSFFSIFFWVFYYQASSSITLYMNEYVDLSVGSFMIPVMWVETTLNGLLCVALGPVVAMIWTKLANRPKGDLNMPQKMALGNLFLAIGFSFVLVAELLRGAGEPSTVKASVIWMILFVVFQTIGEMCFAPLGYSMISKIAPLKYLSFLMGIWAASKFVANKCAGYVQMIVEKMGFIQTVSSILVILLLGMIVMLAMNKKLAEMMEKE